MVIIIPLVIDPLLRLDPLLLHSLGELLHAFGSLLDVELDPLSVALLLLLGPIELIFQDMFSLLLCLFHILVRIDIGL